MASTMNETATKRKNRTLGSALTILALVLAIGTYVGLSLTQFNPFDHPEPKKTEGGTWH